MKKVLFTFALVFMAMTANAQSRFSNFSFNDLDDVFDFVRPTKTFYGSGPIFSGSIEIRCEEVQGGEQMVMYCNGAFLSPVGWEDPDNAAKGKYAKLAVRSGYRQVAVILHLPDNSHSNPYIYFLPAETATDYNLARALDIPVTAGWEWYEPDVQNGRAVLILHTDSKKKPTPIVYNMR